MTKRSCLGLLAGMALIVSGSALSGCGAEKPAAAPENAVSAKSAMPHLSKNYIYGRIVEISGNEWKVLAIHGHIYTVQVTKMTVFGDLFNPRHRGDFRVGDNVRVAGEFVGPAVAATAVDHATDHR